MDDVYPPAPGPAHIAENVRPTRTLTEHTVYFFLGDEDRFVVRRRQTLGYVRVSNITVTLHHDGRVWTHAHGNICRKDGSAHGVTNMNESVDLPDEARWVERARQALKNDGTTGGTDGVS